MWKDLTGRMDGNSSMDQTVICTVSFQLQTFCAHNGWGCVRGQQALPSGLRCFSTMLGPWFLQLWQYFMLP